MNKLIKHFIKSEDGVTALEYGLIAGLVALMIVAGLTNIGTSLQTTFSKIATAVASAAAN
ncbi:Flp family type IVb pilin [Paraburkholderia sp. J12]|uniref:Flp family type IVb pilin n=1 Tax=Paraburkholderia sp. J12 TaxID=2805432 RepID=UPI002ABD29C3|nr:Flp family type IVb pilin [Paraburkholderia sp. J12]